MGMDARRTGLIALVMAILMTFAAAPAGATKQTRKKGIWGPVRVNGVSPGAVLWPESGKSEAEKAALIERTPLKRMGTPGDVASAVLWLIRDAGFVTGEIVRVDGGRHVVG